jgi:acyl-coenzyme A thioesterase PaaI-like protein
MAENLKDLLLRRGDDTSSECFVCGRKNPHGMHVHFAREGENGSCARYIARAEHAGWPGVLHGGVTFSLMDESLGWALFHQGLRAVTARTESKFKRPILTGTPLLIRGWIVNRRRNLISAHAEVRTDDERSELLAETEATMFLLAGDEEEPAEPQELCAR